MATPTIKIDQTGKPAGTAGQSRDDLALNTQVTLTDPANTGGTWQWVLASKPQGSSATLSGATTATAGFWPDVAGTYLIELTWSGTDKSFTDDFGGHVSTQGGAAVKLAGGIRVPAALETLQFGASSAHWTMERLRVASTSGTLSAAIAACGDRTLVLEPGEYALDASVTDTTTTIHFKRGAVITVSASRTLGCNLDFSEGGQIRPSSGVVCTLTGKINLPLLHHAFDLSLSGATGISVGQESLARLTQYNVGAVSGNTGDQTSAFQRHLDICAASVGAFGATGGITPVWCAGYFRLTGNLVVSQYLMRIQCPGEGMLTLHWVPTANGTFIKFEGSSELQRCGFVGGISFSAGGETTFVKTCIDAHDVRKFHLDSISIYSWTTTNTKDSVGIRYRGRDAMTARRGFIDADYPIVIDTNDDGAGGYRDSKDLDHVEIDSFELQADNPRKAAIWIKPGAVFRQLTLGPYCAMVGGGPVCVDKADAAAQNVQSVDPATGVETLTFATNHSYQTGDPVQISNSGGALPGNLSAAPTWYWVIKVSATVIKLASSPTNALAGTAVDMSSAGTGTHTVTGALFAGADVVPRRASDHLEIHGARMEPGNGTHVLDPFSYAIDIRRHTNGKLRELKILSCELGNGRDARRNVQTGGNTLTGVAWGGIRHRGVQRLDVGAECHFGGTAKSLDGDVGAVVNIAPGAELVASDNGRLFPEVESQWADVLKVKAPQHFWHFDQAQGSTHEDLQTGLSPGDMDLQPTGTTNPEGQYLRDGYHAFWSKFTAIDNQKLRLNSTDASVNPDAHAVAASGFVWPDTAWNPTGVEVICNVSGTLLGPLLRVRSDKKIEVQCNSVNTSSQMSYWDDDQPFWYRLFYDPTYSVLRCFVVKADGRREVIVGTWAAGVGNNANKGFGPNAIGNSSPKMWQMYGAWELDDSARQDQVAVAEAMRMLRRTGRMTLADAQGLQLTRTSVSAVSVAAGRIRSDDDTADIVLDAPLAIDLASGGLDTGSEASTIYHVWLFADSRGLYPPTGRFSINAIQPTVPTNYDLKRRVGAVRNNTDLLQFRQVGDGLSRTIFYEEALSVLNVLSAGHATTPTDVALSTLVPSTSRKVHLLAGHTSSTAANKLTLRPDGSGVSDGPWELAKGVANATPGLRWQIEMPCSASQIVEYKVGNAADSGDIWVLGYEDRL